MIDDAEDKISKYEHEKWTITNYHITQYHTADGISIIPYHLWIQMIKTIIDYYVEFEHVQIAR